ncbi:hypothetical protein PFISCL1PPCAC_12100, partial [Pristionchus fissidentatus]
HISCMIAAATIICSILFVWPPNKRVDRLMTFDTKMHAPFMPYTPETNRRLLPYLEFKTNFNRFLIFALPMPLSYCIFE